MNNMPGMPHQLVGVACVSTSVCKAVGEGGTILSWNGTSWTADTSGVTRLLLGVDCASESFCKAMGEDGTILSLAPPDLTPPTLQLPSGVTTSATGPTGAMVTYTATATDSDPPSPVVTCTPPSGSTFPIGTTTVNCSATDATGNTATGSFTITVQGAAAQLADMLAQTHTAVSDAPTRRSLVSILENAQASLSRENTAAACGQLTAFTNQVQAQAGKTIDPATATSLRTDARQIQTALGCR